MDQIRCPKCKRRGVLRVFDDDTLRCSICGALLMVKRKNGQIINIIVPGLGAAASSIAILGFFGISNWDDLVDAVIELFNQEG